MVEYCDDADVLRGVRTLHKGQSVSYPKVLPVEPHASEVGVSSDAGAEDG